MQINFIEWLKEKVKSYVYARVSDFAKVFLSLPTCHLYGIVFSGRED